MEGSVTGVMIKARLGSTRFPQKHIHRLGDTTMIQQLIRKAKRLLGVDPIIIETSWLEEDDHLEDIAHDEDVECFRGHPVNLFERDMACYDEYGMEYALWISGDCPLFDPRISQRLIDACWRWPGHEAYSAEPTLHKPMGGTTSDIHSAGWVAGYKDLLYTHPTPDLMWEHYWVIPREIDTMEIDCDDIMPKQWTPIETSVDYPLQLAILNVVIDYLGYFPRDYSDVARAFRSVRSLAIMPEE